MISTIVDILSGIATFFEHLFSFITFIVTELANAVILVGESIVYGSSVLVQLPVVWVTAFSAVIVIVAIFKVKG